MNVGKQQAIRTVSKSHLFAIMHRIRIYRTNQSGTKPIASVSPYSSTLIPLHLITMYNITTFNA